MSTDTPATAPHISYSQQFRLCNETKCQICNLGAAGHGSYWRAYWREGGHRQSRYRGKHLPPVWYATASG